LWEVAFNLKEPKALPGVDEKIGVI